MIMPFISMRRILAATLLALAACAPVPEPLVPPDPNVDLTPGLNDKEPDTCHATEYAYLVGQPDTALATAGITRPYRVITPGAIITQEYSAQRIDVMVNDLGIITSLSCG